MSSAAEKELAELRARVAALERALERRSLELRALLRGLASADLRRAQELYVPSSPSARELDGWPETHAMRQADIEEALTALWQAAAQDTHEDDRA